MNILCTFHIFMYGYVTVVVSLRAPSMSQIDLLENYYYSLWVFLTSVSWWSFTGVSKSSQVSRTFLSIPADLNNAVVWIVLACPSISNSSSLLTKLLGFIPSAPITIGITITFMFHNFFSSLARFKHLFVPLFVFFIFPQWSERMTKCSIQQVLLFFLTITRCPWCNGYHRRKWTWWYEFKSWTRLIAFHIALM